MSWTTTQALARIEPVEPWIREARGERVILDTDPARLYGVPTKHLNEQVRRNGERFPRDFVFHLSSREMASLRSQFATLKTGRGQHRKSVPCAFTDTEHVAIMAANVLSSPRAVEMSIYVIRAFIKMHASLAGQTDLARRLAEIENNLIGHDTALHDFYIKLRPLLLPPPAPKRREIRSHVREPEKPDTHPGSKRPSQKYRNLSQTG